VGPLAEMLVGLSVSRLEATELSDHRYCPAVPIGRLRSRIDWAKVIVGIRLPSPSLLRCRLAPRNMAKRARWHPFLLCIVFPLADYQPIKQNSGSRCVDPAPSAARIIGGVILRGTPFILAATTKLKLAVVHCHIF